MNSLWAFDVGKVGQLEQAKDLRNRFEPLEWVELELKGKDKPRKCFSPARRFISFNRISVAQINFNVAHRSGVAPHFDHQP